MLLLKTSPHLISRVDTFMHSCMYSSLPLPVPQIATVCSHISTNLTVEDDAEKDLMHLKLPMGHHHSTGDDKQEKNVSKKEQ